MGRVPVPLRTGRIAIVPLVDGTAAVVQIWESGAYDVLVSTCIPDRYVRTVAHHAVTHIGDPEDGGEVTAWCERSTCWAARAWLPVTPVQAAAGL